MKFCFIFNITGNTIKKTIEVMTKKQLNTVSESSNEYEDRLERGDFD